MDVPGVQRQLGVQNTSSDGELLQEQLQAVRSVHVVNEDQTFALDQPQLEDYVDEKEFVCVGASEEGMIRLIEAG